MPAGEPADEVSPKAKPDRQERTGSVAAVVPAKDEAARVAATVRAVATLQEVDLIVVVDDGSSDLTAEHARRAGATVVRHPLNRGKAAAIITGATEVARLEALEAAARPPEAAMTTRALLFVDADLERSAAGLAPLIRPVRNNEADMTIAVLPPQRVAGGGFGFVVRLARDGIQALTGWTPTQPLSGMRCLTRTAYERAQPLAPGWGVEVGLTIDVLSAGGRVVEVPCDLQHRVTGRGWRAQVHRARQYRDVWLALRTRRRAAARRRPAPG